MHMSDELILRNVVAKLRTAIREGGLASELVKKATGDIAAIRSYDAEKFPTLTNTAALKDTSGDAPKTLAEALLWKLGKWKVYKKFAANYTAVTPSATPTDVVLYAFVKHLKDNAAPIYDQHALRALWAICEISVDEHEICRSVLFDGKGHWKKTGSGSDTIECYGIFIKYMTNLLHGRGDLSLRDLDCLLMPLGQALKRTAKTYAKFCEVCDLRSAGCGLPVVAFEALQSPSAASGRG